MKVSTICTDLGIFKTCTNTFSSIISRPRGELIQAELHFNNGVVHTFNNDHELQMFKQALVASDHRDDHWIPDE